MDLYGSALALVNALPLPRGRDRLRLAILRRCRARGNRVAVRLHAGCRMVLDPHDAMTIHLVRDPEPGLRRLLARVLRRGDSFVDVGANWGYYTLLAARRVGVEGSVTAFEPEPYNHGILLENTLRAGPARIRVHAAAVGEHEGVALIRRSTDRPSGQASMVVRDAGQASESEVPVVTLDACCVCPAPPGGLCVLKVDVEGCEWAVFRGARQALSSDRRPVIICELNNQTSLAASYRPTEMLAWLNGEHGYDAYHIHETGHVSPLGAHDDASPLVYEVLLVSGEAQRQALANRGVRGL